MRRIRPSSKRQLIRRAYFDLIGLPPPPEESRAFVDDPSQRRLRAAARPTARQPALRRALGAALARPGALRREPRLRARLRPAHRLPLPRLRHPGAQRRHAVRHVRQVADRRRRVRAGRTTLALKATGFLAAGVHSTQITKNEVEKHRYDEMDDMLATIGTAMLGLTIGCARCHDHKFDPIPQARLLPAALDVHDDGPQRGRTSISTPRAIAKAKAAFDAGPRPAGRRAGEVRAGRAARHGSRPGRSRLVGASREASAG